MTGGLIQLVSYGTQDLFLTGTAQITFFKYIYRRHTNFSIEAVQVPFDTDTDFGKQMVLTVPKNGDLIHKTYLVIDLPAVQLTKDQVVPVETCVDTQLPTLLANLDILITFIANNFTAYRQALLQFDPFPNPNTDDAEGQAMLTTLINTFVSIPGALANRNAYIIMISNLGLFQQFIGVSLFDTSLNLEASGTFNKFTVKSTLDQGVQLGFQLYKLFYDQILECNLSSQDLNSPFAKFAWVSRLGHAIIESVEVQIGGHKIDKHPGQWFDIWYDLSRNIFQEPNYFKMIGNVPQLTNFDTNVKPAYQLSIPFQFWFNRFSGLSIPLVSLDYHDVQFFVTLRDLVNVAYTDGTTGLFNKVHLVDASLYFDYIYLDTDERRRFAQASHEYLIEELQYDIFESITAGKFNAKVDFVHPCKELIWTFQFNDFVDNFEETNNSMWSNFSLTTEGVGNPMAFSYFELNGYRRVPNLEGNYFNYVQPYECHSNTPSDGINVYSFALEPEELQPSGACDMTILDNVVVYMQFDPLVPANANGGTVTIYTRNYNILRFYAGFGALAYTI
jgi:hypothetical protein